MRMACQQVAGPGQGEGCLKQKRAFKSNNNNNNNSVLFISHFFLAFFQWRFTMYFTVMQDDRNVSVVLNKYLAAVRAFEVRRLVSHVVSSKATLSALYPLTLILLIPLNFHKHYSAVITQHIWDFKRQS